MSKWDKVEIVGGRIKNLVHSAYFNVRLDESTNPAICPIVDFEGMPIETLVRKAWDAMKVSARPSMKKLNEKRLKETYDGQEISWRVMVSQEAANALVISAAMTDAELDKQIELLEALKAEREAGTGITSRDDDEI